MRFLLATISLMQLSACGHILHTSAHYENGGQPGKPNWEQLSAFIHSENYVQGDEAFLAISQFAEICDEFDDYSPFYIVKDKEICEHFLLSSKLLPISYSPDKHWGDPDVSAINRYQNMGFDVTYFSPFHGMANREPETYVLSFKWSDEVSASKYGDDVFIVYTGSETYNDWIANFASSIKRPVIEEGFYLPSGAHLVRGRIKTLIKSDFVSADNNGGLKEGSVFHHHLDTYRPGWKTRGDKFDIFLVGHSQGAAHAQMSVPMMHGLCSENDVEENQNCRNIHGVPVEKLEVGRFGNWPLDVSGLFAFAPPYIFSRDPAPGGLTGSPITIENHWDAFDAYGLESLGVMIIQNEDPVPGLWRPDGDFHDVQFRQFGYLYRIDRNQNLSFVEEPNWLGFNGPHASRNYCEAVLKAGSVSAQCPAANPHDEKNSSKEAPGA